MSAFQPETDQAGADLERLRLVYGNFAFMLAGATLAAFVLVWVLNFAFNSTYLSLFPQTQTLR